MKKTLCEKCNHEITANNYKKHIKYCRGIGPRKIERLNDSKRGSEEFKNRISEGLKKYFENDDNRKKLSESLKRSDKNKNRKLSEETKHKISISLMGNRNGFLRKDRQLYYNNIRMDSSWEIKTAKYFDENNIKWEYGKKVFVLSENRSYRPDFYLSDLDLYVEVKGWFREENKEKFNWFLSLYPEIKIEVWDEDKLKQLNIL